MAKQQKTKNGNVLPAGVLESDLVYPSYQERDKDESKRLNYDAGFDLWLISSFGWVVPTLAISRGGQRTYAVAVGEGVPRPARRGAQVRVGNGPHVLEQVRVYVTKGRASALKPYAELKLSGEVGANETRDRISSRRAQGQVMRQQGRSSWRWDL